MTNEKLGMSICKTCLVTVIKESRSIIGSRIDGFVLERAHGLQTIATNRAELIRGFPNSTHFWVTCTLIKLRISDLCRPSLALVAFCPFCFRTRLMLTLNLVTLELTHKQDRQVMIPKFMIRLP